MAVEPQKRVLDMVAEGKLTVEEAERLLNALGQGRRAAQPAAPAAQQPPRPSGNPAGNPFPALKPDQLVAMRIHGVTPEFVAEMRAAGYPDITPDDAVAMRIHGVSPEFAKGMGLLGSEADEEDDERDAERDEADAAADERDVELDAADAERDETDAAAEEQSVRR